MPARWALDKTTIATDRIQSPAVAGRVVSAAYTGHAIAGTAGGAVGAASAAAGTYATWRARKFAVDTTGLPDAAVAIGEDIAAITAAAIATRPLGATQT